TPASRIIEVALQPGRTLAGSVVGPEGKPLAGVEVAGLYPDYVPTEKLSGSDFTLKGLRAGRRRVLIFLDAERKLGKLQEVRGDGRGRQDQGPGRPRPEAGAGMTGREARRRATGKRASRERQRPEPEKTPVADAPGSPQGCSQGFFSGARGTGTASGGNYLR